jgi:hypothetical protein
VVVLLIAAAYLGKDLIKEMDWYKSFEGAAEQARAEIGVAVAISEELERRFPAEDISIGTHTRFGTEVGKSLTIRILNPSFALPEGDEGEVAAREIASFTASQFPTIGDIDIVVVEVHRRRGDFTSQQRYTFPVETLLRETPIEGATALEDDQR